MELGLQSVGAGPYSAHDSVENEIVWFETEGEQAAALLPWPGD